MRTEIFPFPGHDGTQLAGQLDMPDGSPSATALFVHCFTGGKTLEIERHIAVQLTAAGIAILRLDVTGSGPSQSEHEKGSFSASVEDVKCAAKALSERDMEPSMLIGHGLGGTAVLRTAHNLGARAVVTIGAPSTPGHLLHHFDTPMELLSRDGWADLDLGAGSIRVGEGFLHDVAEVPAVSSLKAALLVMHGPRDNVVSIDNAEDIFVAARHPKSFVTLNDADHLLSRPADAKYAAEVITIWARHYLELLPAASSSGAPAGVVRVMEAAPDGFLQTIVSGPSHHALADEPMSVGGTNRGMSPYGFLKSGLGACTSMTIRMYARRKGWPLAGVWVDVTHEKLNITNAETGKSQKIDAFRREIHLDGPLDKSQRNRLLKVADRCPVHLTLEQSSRVETLLA